jgi:hypothetical protein
MGIRTRTSPSKTSTVLMLVGLLSRSGGFMPAARSSFASGEGHRGGGRAHANGLAQNARSGQLVYDQGIRQLQRLAAAGANSKAGDR